MLKLISIFALLILKVSCVVETSTSGQGSFDEKDSVNNLRPFVSVWRITGPNESISLPLRSGFNYNMFVDWGDGQVSHITSFDDPESEHAYTDAGDYRVSITGLAEAWYFNFAGDRNKIIEVIDLGNLGWTNLESAFMGCSNLETFAGGNTSEVTTMRSMFSGANKLNSMDLSSFDTSNVVDMNSMFFNVEVLENLDLTSFDVENVTDMANMFNSMYLLQTINLTSFNTINVTDMSFMFSGNSSLAGLDLSSFNTAKVTTMAGMFQQVDLSFLDIDSFDTSEVVSMASMFESMTTLQSLDLEHFDMSKVTDTSYMFGYSALQELNAMGWDVLQVVDGSDTFAGISPSFEVYCDQGGFPGTGNLFTESCL